MGKAITEAQAPSLALGDPHAKTGRDQLDTAWGKEPVRTGQSSNSSRRRSAPP